MAKQRRKVAAALGVAAVLGGVWSGCGSGDPSVDTVKKPTTASAGATMSTGGGGSGGGDLCPGATLCGEVCTNTKFDPGNCGACGKSCGAGEVCASGACAQTCESGGTKTCGTSCVDVMTDVKNCGDCGKACDAGEVCVGGNCQLECGLGTTKCDDGCFDLKSDPTRCGSCNKSCDVQAGQVCSQGLCAFSCLGGTTNCKGLCVEPLSDPKNCGGCGTACKDGEVCDGGNCFDKCGIDLEKCGSSCVDLTTDTSHCGDCNTVCATNELCSNGACKACDSSVTDCDGDGWKVADGDCCDLAGACGANPALVNPGAVEVLGNGIDDNCNGKQDLYDLPDTASCDATLTSNSGSPTDYAKALGICRTTSANPALKNRTWGLVEARLVRADGSPLGDARARSIRNTYGSILPATLEGQKSVVLSTGIAADKQHTNPGPNTTTDKPSTTHTPVSSVDITTCADPLCIKDWFSTANAPLKKANELPVAPDCGTGNSGSPNVARDSVMLVLKLRAPTNARAFALSSYFFSAEFPTFVCSNFNDQFAILVDTPKPTLPVPNPVDKNLLVFDDGKGKWPIGINIAKGTSLFNVCDLACATEPNQGGNAKVSAASCSLGAGQLVNSGFGLNGDSCPNGGGSFWLTTTGNVVPGQLVTLRVVVWDVGDSSIDSTVVLDGFKWLLDSTVPGTAEM